LAVGADKGQQKKPEHGSDVLSMGLDRDYGRSS
jgi:hypothetical protein